MKVAAAPSLCQELYRWPMTRHTSERATRREQTHFHHCFIRLVFANAFTRFGRLLGDVVSAKITRATAWNRVKIDWSNASTTRANINNKVSKQKWQQNDYASVIQAHCGKILKSCVFQIEKATPCLAQQRDYRDWHTWVMHIICCIQLRREPCLIIMD